MKVIRLLLCSLMLVATHAFAARDDMYKPSMIRSSGAEGLYWFEMTCQKEYVGTMQHPPIEVEGKYQYTLSKFNETTGAAGSGDLTMCYVQLDASTYQRLMDFLKKCADQNITLRQAFYILNLETKELKRQASPIVDQNNLMYNALFYFQWQDKEGDDTKIKMRDVYNQLKLEAEALKKRREK